jgi:hypothetical protein
MERIQAELERLANALREPQSGLRNLPRALYAQGLAIKPGGTLELDGGSAPARSRTS